MFTFCSFDFRMQLEFPIGREDRLLHVHQTLRTAFGKPPPAIRLDPVSQLILTMLSARTKGHTAKRAFVALAAVFADWRALASSSSDIVEYHIRRVTFSERKAVFLPRSLRRIITLRNSLSLDFLHDWPVDAALEWLELLPGVGPKTSAAILNFSPLQKRALVVDTAHYRAALRIGLLQQNARFNQAALAMMRQIPHDWTADDIEDHHILMQELGKTFCRYKEPCCSRCPVRHYCDYYSELPG
ncbi:MAG: Fe-S cluster assembly protein HesB [Pseudomonadota bacterium]